MIRSVEGTQIAMLGRASFRVPAYSIILYNHEEELISLGQWINKIASEQRLSRRVAFGLDLCLAEVVGNCVEHAFFDQEQHPIFVHAEFHSKVVRLLIVDGGIPFNPLERIDEHPPRTLDEAPIGRLGISILKQYASLIRYQRLEEHNLLELLFKKNFSPAAARNGQRS